MSTCKNNCKKKCCKSGTVNLPGGQDGASAYEIAVANGFIGTQQEWLDSLQGDDGDDGQDGQDAVYTLLDTIDFTTVNLLIGQPTLSGLFNIPTDNFIEEVVLEVVTPFDVDNFSQVTFSNISLGAAVEPVIDTLLTFNAERYVVGTDNNTAFKGYDPADNYSYTLVSTLGNIIGGNSQGEYRLYVKYGTTV